MDPVFQKKMEDFIAATTAGLKANKENSERLIAEVEAKVRGELQAYYDKVKQLNVSVPGLAEEEAKRKAQGKQFNLSKMLFAIAKEHAKELDPWKDAGHELEIIKDTHTRATVSGLTGGVGGYLIPIEVAKEILKPAMADTVMRDLGITVYEDLVGDLPFPEITSRPTLSWIQETGAATAQGVGVADRMMRPKTGSMLVKVSQRLIMQTSGLAEQIVREMMQEGISLGIDDVCMNGTGGASQPLGLLQNAAIPTSAAIGAAGGRLRVDKVASMVSDVEVNNYLKTGGGGLLCHPKVKSGLKREKVAQYSGDTAGMPLLNPFMTDKAVEDATGLKIRSTTAVPSNIVKSTSSTLSAAIVGEFKQFILGLWGGLALKASDQAGTAFTNRELWVVAFVDADTMVKQVNGFRKISDAETLEANW